MIWSIVPSLLMGALPLVQSAIFLSKGLPLLAIFWFWIGCANFTMAWIGWRSL